ncbi:MAG: lipoate--protein ligase family protein [Candidatus Hodarchaeales archaeon]|jgi:lipoate-protein ligase A
MQSRILTLDVGDIHHDLALEQAILNQHSHNGFDATVRFWRTPKAVILGRSQDIDQEIDIPYCKGKNIIIARRISGGGSVYTDQGNLNISISMKKANFNIKRFNYKKVAEIFSNLLVKSLSPQYPDQSFEVLNSSSVLFQNKKISGSAGYMHREWVLHHLTLLYDANLNYLNTSLRAGKSDYLSNKPSNFHPTMNLHSLSVNKFQSDLITMLTNHFNIDFVKDSVTEKEKSLAQLLKEKMYSQESWIVHKKRKLLENSFRTNRV